MREERERRSDQGKGRRVYSRGSTDKGRDREGVDGVGVVEQIGDGARSIASARGPASRSRRRGANVLLTLHPPASAAHTVSTTLLSFSIPTIAHPAIPPPITLTIANREFPRSICAGV